jgi:hypothetical protein
MFENVSAISGGLKGTGFSEYDNDFKFNMSSSKITNSDYVAITCQGNSDNFFIENNWWGANEIETVANFSHPDYPVGVPSIYAIFDTSSNYLGNNQWEIIGKLKALGAEGILVLPIEKMIL